LANFSGSRLLGRNAPSPQSDEMPPARVFYIPYNPKAAMVHVVGRLLRNAETTAWCVARPERARARDASSRTTAAIHAAAQNGGMIVRVCRVRPNLVCRAQSPAQSGLDDAALFFTVPVTRGEIKMPADVLLKTDGIIVSGSIITDGPLDSTRDLNTVGDVNANGAVRASNVLCRAVNGTAHNDALKGNTDLEITANVIHFSANKVNQKGAIVGSDRIMQITFAPDKNNPGKIACTIADGGDGLLGHVEFTADVTISGNLTVVKKINGKTV
jgi:hypothetical protein